MGSLQQYNLDKVVLAEECAALITAQYASLIIDVNDEYYPQLTAGRDLITDSEIESLRKQHEELNRFTNYVLVRNNILESFRNLEEKWRAQINDEQLRYPAAASPD